MLLRPTDRILPSLLCPHLWRILILAAALSKCHGVLNCTERTSYTQCIDTIHRRVMNEPGMLTCNEVKYVAAGDTEMLNCQVQSDVEVIFNGWNFYPSNGGNMVSNVQDNDARITAETDRLTITNIQPEDEGLYACIASENGAPEGTVTAGCIIVHATARGYTDTTVRIEAVSNEEVTLPTAVVFEKAGSCGITPKITQARLRYEPDMNILFHCMTSDCVVNNQTRYAFRTFGDVTLVPPDVLPGQYLMALIQMCPTLIPRMTYDVVFTDINPTPSAAATSTSPTTSNPTGGSNSGRPTTSNPTVDTGGSKSGSSDNTSNILIGVLVTVVLTLIIGVAMAVLFLYIFHKRRPHTFTPFLPKKEPVYEDPNRMENGVQLVSELQREESIYSGKFPPSTIGGDNNGMGPYEMDIHLNEKPTDELGSI